MTQQETRACTLTPSSRFALDNASNRQLSEHTPDAHCYSDAQKGAPTWSMVADSPASSRPTGAPRDIFSRPDPSLSQEISAAFTPGTHLVHTDVKMRAGRTTPSPSSQPRTSVSLVPCGAPMSSAPSRADRRKASPPSAYPASSVYPGASSILSASELAPNIGPTREDTLSRVPPQSAQLGSPLHGIRSASPAQSVRANSIQQQPRLSSIHASSGQHEFSRRSSLGPPTQRDHHPIPTASVHPPQRGPGSESPIEAVRYSAIEGQKSQGRGPLYQCPLW